MNTVTQDLLIAAGKAHNVAVVSGIQVVVDTPAAHLVLKPCPDGADSFNRWLQSITAGSSNDNGRPAPRPVA